MIVQACTVTGDILTSATFQKTIHFISPETSDRPPTRDSIQNYYCDTVAYPGILFGRGSTNSVEDRGRREWGSGEGSPLVRGSGGSCNLVQEISFHTVKFS